MPSGIWSKDKWRKSSTWIEVNLCSRGTSDLTQALGLATCSRGYEVGIIDGILEIRKQ